MKFCGINHGKFRSLRGRFIAGAVACAGAVLVWAPPSPAQQQNPPARSAPQPAWLFRMHAWPGGTAQLENPQDDAQQAANADLQTMMDNMQSSAQRLQANDPGVQTQQDQAKIVQSLSELIALVAQMTGSGSSSSSSRQNPAMQLQMNQNPSGPQPMSPSSSATNSYIPPAGSLTPGGSQPLDSQRSEWGNLPPAARNMILNAMHSEALPEYKQQVDSYYRALAQIDQQQQNQ
jgi:hypothetical protein